MQSVVDGCKGTSDSFDGDVSVRRGGDVRERFWESRQSDTKVELDYGNKEGNLPCIRLKHSGVVLEPTSRSRMSMVCGPHISGITTNCFTLVLVLPLIKSLAPLALLSRSLLISCPLRVLATFVGGP